MKPLKKSMATIGILILMAILLELLSRAMGYEPGNLAPSWANFKKVDSLIVYNHFYTNENGIVVANKDHFKQQQTFINQAGFRNKEFENLDTQKAKILLIGDSFTWGLSADPLSSSFADILKKDTTYETINCGIPVADPVQYEAIAKLYIPKIKPQLVFVILYLGNDIMMTDRKIIPHKPLYFFTNAGAMMAEDNGQIFQSAQEAYNYYRNEKYFISTPQSITEKLALKSALISLILGLENRWLEKQKLEDIITQLTVTKNHLRSLSEICAKNKCLFRFILLPKMEEANRKEVFFRKKYAAIFLDADIGKECVLPSTLTAADYKPNPDGHLNNNGHEKIAKILHQNINTIFSNQIK
jgi:hypothetical protein